nr:DUF1800 domain-containing protein [Vibrio agarilyticus]
MQHATATGDEDVAEELAALGYITWMSQQFALPFASQKSRYDAIDTALQGAVPQDNCRWVRFDRSDVREGIWWESLLFGEDQLRQRAAFALSQLLVVSRKDNPMRNHPQALTAYYDILLKHAFGNYRDLLEEITLSPAMGAFLSMANSKKANPKRGTFPDENFAREVMQLFTIGLYELNLDGSVKRDASGNPISTYSQKDVEEVARALSGWTYSDIERDEEGKIIHGKGYVKPMEPGSDKWGVWHDSEAKVVLGHVLPAGQAPLEDVQAVLDILFEHSNTAPFVARHLIQRLVTSNPSPEYIERVASVFVDNGQGVRGDLKSVLAAVWLDSEALNGAVDSTRYPIQKLKEPVLALAEVFHRLNAEKSDSNAFVLDTNEVFKSVAQGPLSANSVFNFYSPDYKPSGPLLDNQLFAPEFEIFPWAGFIGYQNIVRTRMNRVAKPDTLRCDNALHFDLTDYHAAAQDADAMALPNLINQRFFGGAMSDELTQAILTGAEKEKPTAYHNKAALAITLAVTSPEFLIQR